jgi:hypothetical protein
MIGKTPAVRQSKNTHILRDLSGILGISLNQAAAYLAVVVFHLQILYYMVIVFVFTLIFSLAIRSLSRAIIGTITSMIIGAVITLGILLTPSIAFKLNMDTTITVFSSYAARLIVLNLVVSILSAIIGGIISEI